MLLLTRFECEQGYHSNEQQLVSSVQKRQEREVGGGEGAVFYSCPQRGVHLNYNNYKYTEMY